MLYITQRQPQRCELLGQFIIEYGATVRETAKRFGISKSTVHKDVTFELQRINRPLYERVSEILQKNKKELIRALLVFLMDYLKFYIIL